MQIRSELVGVLLSDQDRGSVIRPGQGVPLLVFFVPVPSSCAPWPDSYTLLYQQYWLSKLLRHVPTCVAPPGGGWCWEPPAGARWTWPAGGKRRGGRHARHGSSGGPSAPPGQLSGGADARAPGGQLSGRLWAWRLCGARAPPRSHARGRHVRRSPAAAIPLVCTYRIGGLVSYCI